MRRRLAALPVPCVILCLFFSVNLSQVHAQSAGEAADDTELPLVEVTTPSPVTKRARARRQQDQAAPADVGEATAEGAASVSDTTNVSPAEIAAAPGTLLVVEESFAPVTVATEQEIEAKLGATITDTLSTKPGISGSTFAPGANRPIIRGLDNYRVRVQENGIGTHDVSALSEDHAVPIDPYSADRIEVVRGPATLRYGSQAIGGVVSVENQRVPTYIPKGGFSSELTGGLSSVDDGRDGAFEATAGSGGVAVHADGFRRESEDYDTPRGRVDNSFVDSEGGSVGGSLVGSDGFLGVAVARVESVYGIPGEEARIDLEQDKVLSRGEWRVNSSGVEALRFWFGATDYEHDEVAGTEIGSTFTNREQEARAELEHVPFMTVLGETRGALGVQWGHRTVRAQSFEGDSLLEPAETDVIAGFLFEEVDLSQELRFQAATRLEHSTSDGTGLADVSDPLAPITFTGERSFAPFSVSAGFLYQLPMGVVARLTSQYVERAPDAAELFSKGLHEATETFEIGNPFLEKEKARTIEIGLKRATGALRFDGSIYYTSYNGFIFKELTGKKCADELATCDDGDPTNDELDLLVFGQRDATFYGAELAAQYDVAKLWRGVWGVDGQYDFVHAEFDDGENIQRIPPHRLGGGIYYGDPNWYARIGALHAFRQDEIGVNETPTDGYTLLSAEIAYTQKLDGTTGLVPEFSIGLKGENLLDDDVRNHASFRKDEVLQPGASVRLFGSIKLN